MPNSICRQTAECSAKSRTQENRLARLGIIRDSACFSNWWSLRREPSIHSGNASPRSSRRRVSSRSRQQRLYFVTLPQWHASTRRGVPLHQRTSRWVSAAVVGQGKRTRQSVWGVSGNAEARRACADASGTPNLPWRCPIPSWCIITGNLQEEDLCQHHSFAGGFAHNPAIEIFNPYEASQDWAGSTVPRAIRLKPS
jgi:hypothetical protein